MAEIQNTVTIHLSVPGVDVDISFQSPSINETTNILNTTLHPLQKAILEGSIPYCPVHHVPMTYHEKDGRGWWSHKLSNGQWCSGLPDPTPAFKPQQRRLPQAPAPEPQPEGESEKPPF